MTGCLLPALFAAHQGVAEPLPLLPPVGGGHISPPYPEKTLLFEPLAHRIDTENFSVQWSDSSVSESAGSIAAEALEQAWTVLVEEENWGPPHTGEWAKITVFLDPWLGGTGVTTGLLTDDNPMGAPLIYLNPTYVDQPDFFRSVAVHEFGHALQFRFRSWYDAPETEPWYWEATSEWMTEVVNPDWDQYAWSSSWYAADPGANFDSMEGYHQYGMMLLNAYFDAHRGGVDTIWSIWMDNQNEPWLMEIERVLGESAIDTWSDFVGAYGAERLVDSHLFERPELSDVIGQISGHLGSAYIDLGVVSGTVELSAGMGTLIRDGRWTAFDTGIAVPDGDGPVTLVVTNPEPTPLDYSVTIRPAEDDGTDGSYDADGTIENQENTVGSESPDATEETPQGCSCSTKDAIRSRANGVVWSVLMLLGFRRRVAQRAECPPQ